MMAEEVESGQIQKEVESGQETRKPNTESLKKNAVVSYSNSLRRGYYYLFILNLLEKKENFKICQKFLKDIFEFSPKF